MKRRRAILCEECEVVIPQIRRDAMPGVRCCIKCQVVREIRADDLTPDVLAESPIDSIEMWGR